MDKHTHVSSSDPRLGYVMILMPISNQDEWSQIQKMFRSTWSGEHGLMTANLVNSQSDDNVVLSDMPCDVVTMSNQWDLERIPIEPYLEILAERSR